MSRATWVIAWKTRRWTMWHLEREENETLCGRFLSGEQTTRKIRRAEDDSDTCGTCRETERRELAPLKLERA